MQQPGQVRKEFGVSRRLVLEFVDQLLRPHLFHHPGFEERFGGVPEIEIGIELAAQTLDIEQGLLEQNQLRLDLDVESTRGLEKAHQHHAQRNLLQRAVEVRFADAADGGLHLVDTRAGRHPARFDVQLRHPFVVAPEEGGEVLRQVLFVELGQGPDDAEIQRDIAPEGVGRQADLDVARMHIGMEEPVAKDLREEDGHTISRQFGDIHPSRPQALDLVDRNALHSLHHDDV